MFSNWVKSNILHLYMSRVCLMKIFLESRFISEMYLLENRTGFVNILLSKVYNVFKKFESSFDTSKGQYVNIKKIPMIFTRNKQLKVLRLLKSKDFYDMFNIQKSLLSLILKICGRECLTYTEQKKERYHFGAVTFLSSR